MRTVSHKLGIALLLSLSVFAANDARADEFSEHQRLGAEYLQNQKYLLALQELQAAYKIQQRPLLMYYIARCYHHMGQRREAIEYYDRYIVSETDPERRVNAQRYIDELGGAGPAGVASEGPVTRTPEASRGRPGMVIAGATLFGLAYGSALLVGTLGLIGTDALSQSGFRQSDINLAQASFGTLLVPIGGPVISGLIVRSAEWSLPWMMLNVPAQIVGVALMSSGAQSRKSQAPKLTLLPSFSGTTASLTLAGSL